MTLSNLNIHQLRKYVRRHFGSYPPQAIKDELKRRRIGLKPLRDCTAKAKATKAKRIQRARELFVARSGMMNTSAIARAMSRRSKLLSLYNNVSQ